MIKILRTCSKSQDQLGGIRRHFSLSPKGQSLVEITLLFPVLLILLSGLMEFGFMLNEYLTLQDAVRNAARFSSDSDYLSGDTTTNETLCSTTYPQRNCCERTTEFFRQTSCLVNIEMTGMAPDVNVNCLELGAGTTCNYGVLDPNNGRPGQLDDIVLSIFSVQQGQTTLVRRFGGEQGWSYAEHCVGYSGGRNQSSRYTVTDITNRLNASAPNTGYLLVEIFYNYEMKLKLPWITAFVPDPVMLHAYAFMPLVSAEPTPTPIP